MAGGLLLMIGASIGSFIAGLVVFYGLLKYKVTMPRRQADHLLLELPVFGQIRTRCRIKYAGLYLDEWEEFNSKVA